MKKLIAAFAALTLILSLAACGGGGSSAKLANSTTLKYEEDENTHYDVKLGYADGATLNSSDADRCTITNEAKDYEVTVSLSADTTYKENKDYDKANAELFKEGKFSGFDGYSYKESDYSYYVIIDLGSTEYENENLQLSFTIGSAARDMQKTAEQLYQIDEVQSMLNSFEFLGKNPESK